MSHTGTRETGSRRAACMKGLRSQDRVGEEEGMAVRSRSAQSAEAGGLSSIVLQNNPRKQVCPDLSARADLK
jgi:hypothetical protein